MKKLKITKINGRPQDSKRFLSIMREIQRMNLQHKITDKSIIIPLLNFKFELEEFE